jgi:hypothetical protein
VKTPPKYINDTRAWLIILFCWILRLVGGEDSMNKLEEIHWIHPVILTALLVYALFVFCHNITVALMEIISKLTNKNK